MHKYLEFLSFQGRASRLTFWRFQLASTVAGGAVMMLILLLVSVIGRVAGVALLLFAPIFLAAVATGVRRLHDRGRTGWWLALYAFGPGLLVGLATTWTGDGLLVVQAFASLTSLALWLWGVIDLGVLSGEAGPNRFGANPMSPAPQEAFS